MKIKTEEVYYLARLARLHLSEDEAENVSERLSKILMYMSKLDSLESVNERTEPDAFQKSKALREDILSGRISHDEALSQSPDVDSSFFRVPKVIS